MHVISPPLISKKFRIIFEVNLLVCGGYCICISVGDGSVAFDPVFGSVRDPPTLLFFLQSPPQVEEEEEGGASSTSQHSQTRQDVNVEV